MNKFTVAPVFQSHMVLQRDKPVVVWGSAPKSSSVTVTLCGSKNTAIAENGMWKCILPPQNAGKGYQRVILCDYPGIAPICLDQISIGDVWLACGQSNMEFFLRYDEEWEKIKNYEYNPDIHMYNVPQLAFPGHKKIRTDMVSGFRKRNRALKHSPHRVIPLPAIYSRSSAYPWELSDVTGAAVPLPHGWMKNI